MLNFLPADNSFAEVLRTRRTITEFQPAPVSEETILQAIDVARWAPNHKMTEPWRFHLIGPETQQQIIDLNREFLTREKGAEAAQKKMARWQQIPGWLIVTCQCSPDPLRNEENYAAVCCSIQNLMLYLWSQKIGTKWSTSSVLREPQLAAILQIDPDLERVVGLLWYGYPAMHSQTRRRPVSEITLVHS